MSDDRRALRVLVVLAAIAFAPGALAQTWSYQHWGTLDPSSTWLIASGDFTGNGLDDVVGYDPTGPTIQVGTNDGSSLSFSTWGSGVPAGVAILAGDFAGDSLDDVVIYDDSDGSIYVGTNLGGSFSFTSWFVTDPLDEWSFVAGSFAGDAKSDLAGYHPSSGVIEVGTNTGSSFSFSNWASLSPGAGWEITAGDFTGDGDSDVLGYYEGNFSVWVGINLGSSFDFGAGPWTNNLSAVPGWTFGAADVEGSWAFDRQGDGFDDMIAYHDQFGVFSGRNLSPDPDRPPGEMIAFSPPLYAPIPASGWSFTTGNFWRTDVAGTVFYYPPTGALLVSSWIPEGYAWPLSAAAGERIEFMVSGIADPNVDFLRHTSTGETVTSVLMASGNVQSELERCGYQPWRNGCGWPVGAELVVPAGWRSGIYSARLRAPNGDAFHIPFIVNPSPAARSRVAVIANTNTWLAYERWGGLRKYTKGTIPGAPRFSYLKPLPGASPIGETASHHHLTRAELWILGWLDAEAYSPDVYTDIDLHDGSFLDHYRVLVVGTHPEYWTAEMFDKLESFLDQGGHLLYLGGNGLFETATYTVDRRAMTFLNGVADIADTNAFRADAYLRNLPAPRPERSLLGMSTQDCTYAPGSPLLVLEPDHPLLRGTGLGVGGKIGDSGCNTGGGGYNGKASAWEIDHSGNEAAMVCGTIGAAMNPQPQGALPPGLTVLARADMGGAEMTYYDHPGGGFVLSAGSITLGGSLVKDLMLQRIIRNALNDAGVVRRVPATSGIALVLLIALLGMAGGSVLRAHRAAAPPR